MPRLGSRAAGRFEQDLEGSVERGLRRLEMTGFELLLAVFEVLVGERDQIGDGIGLGRWSRGRGRRPASPRAPAAGHGPHFLLQRTRPRTAR